MASSRKAIRDDMLYGRANDRIYSNLACISKVSDIRLVRDWIDFSLANIREHILARCDEVAGECFMGGFAELEEPARSSRPALSFRLDQG